MKNVHILKNKYLQKTLETLFMITSTTIIFYCYLLILEGILKYPMSYTMLVEYFSGIQTGKDSSPLYLLWSSMFLISHALFPIILCGSLILSIYSFSDGKIKTGFKIYSFPLFWLIFSWIVIGLVKGISELF